MVNAHRNPLRSCPFRRTGQRDGSLPACLQHRLGGGGRSARAGWDSRNTDARPTGSRVDQAALFETSRVLGHRGLGQRHFVDQFAGSGPPRSPGVAGSPARWDHLASGTTPPPGRAPPSSPNRTQ